MRLYAVGERAASRRLARFVVEAGVMGIAIKARCRRREVPPSSGKNSVGKEDYTRRRQIRWEFVRQRTDGAGALRYS